MLKPMDTHIIAHLHLKDRHCPKCKGYMDIERTVECDEIVCLNCGRRIPLDLPDIQLVADVRIVP